MSLTEDKKDKKDKKEKKISGYESEKSDNSDTETESDTDSEVEDKVVVKKDNKDKAEKIFNENVDLFIKFFITLQTNTKLYHWHVNNYNKHVITGDLYTLLEPDVDNFVEIIQGLMEDKLSYKEGKGVLYELKQMNDNEFKKYLEKCLVHINTIKVSFELQTQIVNILDNIDNNILKTLYKLGMQ